MLPSVVALPTTSTPTLVRSIRPWDLVAVVINAVIGAGIFGLPSKVFALAGNYSLISFVLCAACVCLIVLSFAEVGSRFSTTGGPYLFARETYGPLTGFTVGWLVWVARITSFSANINLLPAYLGFFFPKVATGAPRAVILTAIIVLLTVLNVRGVRKVADASNVFAAGKLLTFLIFIAVGLFFIVPGRFVLAAAPDYRSFSQTILLLVYAFTGFEMALIPAGEIRNPEKILPWALLVGMSIVVAAYIAIQVVCIGTLPELASSQRPLADAAARFLGTGGAIMITTGIVLSLSGNLNILILSASRVMFAMAEHDQLPAWLAKVHPRFRTPAATVVVAGAVNLALTLSGTFIYLVAISTISRLITYMITCSALPVLRRRVNVPKAMFHAPGGVAAAVLA
ncbi:MAG TPA: amino acid permease, partial [Rhizomicrobium sp.]|nr:amino acid permease [Rhizomicrobium sp.]